MYGRTGAAGAAIAAGPAAAATGMPVTGSSLGWFVALGVLLVLTGALLLRMSRRKAATRG